MHTRQKEGGFQVAMAQAQNVLSLNYLAQSYRLREMIPLERHLRSRPRPTEATVMVMEGHIPLKPRKAQCAFLVSIRSPAAVPQWLHK